MTNISVQPYQLRCKLDEYAPLHLVCLLPPLGPGCNMYYASAVCESVACPGLFKCPGYLCLPMSMVCDNHKDCANGEDEDHCNPLLCPGLVKCRGENKCVTPSQVCDGRQDCTHTPDDEITCYICPSNCSCYFYVVSCQSDTLSFLSQLNKDVAVKGLYLEGNITALDLTFVFRFLFIDMSHCNITFISNSIIFLHTFICIDSIQLLGF